MSQPVREKALRALVAALLTSGLTPREIKDVARTLRADPTMVDQLARLIEVLAENLSSEIKPKRTSPSPAEDMTTEPLYFIQSAEGVDLPREVFARRLQSYAPQDWRPRLTWSRRKLLQEFVKVAPPSALKRALAALKAGPVEQDPFVDLVMKTAKRSLPR